MNHDNEHNTPYLVGMVDHVTKDEMARITVYHESFEAEKFCTFLHVHGTYLPYKMKYSQGVNISDWRFYWKIANI